MKKKFRALLFLLAVHSVFSYTSIFAAVPCGYKEIELFKGNKSVKSSVSYAECVQDVDMLCYILAEGYAGYDDMRGRGFDEAVFRKNLLEQFQNETEVNTRRFFHAVQEQLLPFINDAHFMLVHYFEAFTFCTKSVCLWSDIYVRKTGETYTVCESGCPSVKIGAEYTGGIGNLFYYPAKGDAVFRLGVLSGEHKKAYPFSFDGRETDAAVSDDGAIEIRPMKYHDFATEDSAYVALNSFLPPSDDSSGNAAAIILEKFVRCALKYNGKKHIIIDMRSNQGGEQTYPALFLYALYTADAMRNFQKAYKKVNDWTVHTYADCLFVSSPVSVQAQYLAAKERDDRAVLKNYSAELKKIRARPERSVVHVGQAESSLFGGKKRFSGKLIFLSDRNTCSAGEDCMYMAKKLFGAENVIIIGENTYGMCGFWHVITLGLPNSRIGVHTAFKKNVGYARFSQWQGEGVGILPDYWASGADLNETVYLVTGDAEMKKKLSGIESRLM